MKNIYQSIADIMQEVPSISKEKVNKQQGFKYRGIDDVMNAFQPILAKNRVFIVPEVIDQTREERTTKNGGNLIYSICKIRFKFFAEDGSFVEAVTVGEGMDSADKSTNKAMAVAMKYAMFQVFCIPTEEMIDPDGDTPPNSFKQQEQEPDPKVDKKSIALINELATMYAGIKNGNATELTKYYLKKYKVAKVEDLTELQAYAITQELSVAIERYKGRENK